jgi:hypothetical protein
VFSISVIPVMGYLPSWCTQKFTACFEFLHTRTTRQQTDTTFTKRGLAMKTLCRVTSVKTMLSNTFLQSTESNQDLVRVTYSDCECHCFTGLHCLYPQLIPFINSQCTISSLNSLSMDCIGNIPSHLLYFASCYEAVS